MFIDKASIRVKAGDGGNGAVSFHREKYVAAGGPDGGDGGRGGSVYFVADDTLSTLSDFRYKHKFEAQNGQPGGAKRCSGKSAPDLMIKVPRGTVVTDTETGRIVADVSGDDPVLIAKGGNGGWGNCHFATPTRQVPRFAKPGIPGEIIDVTLELKLLADVGLIGFPNVGKSTLISVVSEAKPTIANYHFTTLTPVLGVVRVDGESSFVMADIPGLIEGASEGVGLGHEFLRHVERCRLLVHVVDVSGSEGRDPVDDFDKINAELKNYSEELSTRPQIVAANKVDMADHQQIDRFRKYVEDKGLLFYEMSAPITHGTKELIYAVSRALSELPPVKVYEPEPERVEQIVDRKDKSVKVHREGEVFVVEGQWLWKVMQSVNFDDRESLQFFESVLISNGVIKALEDAGVSEGDTVLIYDLEFEFRY